jgi:hypothetical protein
LQEPCHPFWNIWMLWILGMGNANSRCRANHIEYGMEVSILAW